MKSSVFPLIIAALSAPAFAVELNDAAPVDMKTVLAGLKQFKEQNETGLRTRRNAAYKQITAAAASNEAASAFWTNAVLAVQFAGVDHQAPAVRDWLKGEGEGLKTKEGANAARLHLVWLGRREIAGIAPGVQLRASGRVSYYRGIPTIFNPFYEIVPKNG